MPPRGASLTRASAVSYTNKNSNAYFVDDRSCNRVHFPDHCRAAAKRQGCGSGRCIWRDGLADSVRPAGFGDAALQGYDGLRHRIHDYVAFVVDPGDAEFGIGEDGFGELSGDFHRFGQEYDDEGAHTGSGSEEPIGAVAATETGRSTGAGSSGPEEVAPLAEVAELADALA